MHDPTGTLISFQWCTPFFPPQKPCSVSDGVRNFLAAAEEKGVALSNTTLVVGS